MSSLTTTTTTAATLVIAFAMVSLASGCKRKVTQAQCDELLDHYAELVVKAQFPDAGAAMIAEERTRERLEAKRTDDFKNCTTEVQESERVCAMAAQTPEAVIKCLE